MLRHPPDDLVRFLREIDRHLAKPHQLEVFVPERHDLALMKIIRGEEHDIQVLVEMHESEPFDLEILKNRFINEMKHVIGDLRWIRLNFVGLVEELFGEAPGKKVDEITESWGLPK